LAALFLAGIIGAMLDVVTLRCLEHFGHHAMSKRRH
jgi:hypothetical protein